LVVSDFRQESRLTTDVDSFRLRKYMPYLPAGRGGGGGEKGGKRPQLEIIGGLLGAQKLAQKLTSGGALSIPR
jgi:hypothetical protein